jgi:HTH-type transcriptional regulator/antitoxin HigA
MNEHFLVPSRAVKEEMVKRGLTQKDVAIIIGKSESYISDNLSKERISVEFAQELSVVLGQNPKYWLDIANNYQLAMLGEVSGEIKARNRLLQEYPLKAMQQRGWISKTNNLEVLQSDVEILIQNGAKVEKNTSFKRTVKEESFNLNYSEKFWLYRTIALSTMLPVDNKYDEKKLPALFSLLKKATKSSQVVDKIPEFLHRYGIGFLVVQPLPGTKIDGAALWLNENSPVVALTLRFDNIGSFWFALIHELTHIKNRDFFSLDNLQEEATSETEKRTNKETSEFLVPSDEMKLFIKNTAPYYSKIKINNFANKLKVHPGIIVGQLQHSKEIGYNTHHEAMVPVREFVTRPAFTDGWGHPVPVSKYK